MRVSLAALLLLLLLPARTHCGLTYPLPPAANAAPTIGVLSVPMAGAGSPCDTAASGAGSSCFTAFYFHWLQAAGARAVILPVDAEPATLDALLDSVNGVLLTGGSLENLTWGSAYMVTAARIYSRVLEKNRNGTFFPLHGTCQGFQVLALLTSQDQGVVSYNAFDSEDLVIPLDISVRWVRCRKAAHFLHPHLTLSSSLPPPHPVPPPPPFPGSGTATTAPASFPPTLRQAASWTRWAARTAPSTCTTTA
jgi:hypothetical protein